MPEILTPKPSLSPRVNGPKVFGVRPGSPVLFKISATGEKPLEYGISDLPDGLTLDSQSGMITGQLNDAGTYSMHIQVNNQHGIAERDFQIICGYKICLTPPMGWNSWYVYSLWVSQEKIEAMAKAMVESGLADHGWTYINIDDAWQGLRDPESKVLQPNDKFPDMKAMCDHVHALGLKIGIYSTPWVGSYAGYIGGASPNPEMDYTAMDAPMESRLEKNQLHGQAHHLRSRWYHHGPIGCEEFDAKQWAEWGFDYLKYDWNPNDVSHVTTMLNAIKSSGRDMIYSLSNSAPFDHANDWVNLANLWRTTGDIQDLWRAISRIGFNQDKWIPYAGPSHWNDPDMLQVGMTAEPHKETPESRPSRLTPDEQYTQMSLWCLLSAPLLLSCNLTKLDDFTIGLLTNDEVLEINQDSLGIAAHTIAKAQSLFAFKAYQILAKDLEDGSKAVGLFNKGKVASNITVQWKDLGFSGTCSVRDLWRQQDLGTFPEKFTKRINSHGVLLLKIKPI